MIEEVKTIYDANLDRPYIVNPKTIDSKVKRYIRVTSRYLWLRCFILPSIVIFSKNPTLTGNDPSKVSSGRGRFVIVEPRRKLKFAICKYIPPIPSSSLIYYLRRLLRSRLCKISIFTAHSVERIRVTTWNTRAKANSLGPIGVTIR